MARERMVTRTIDITVSEVMSLNIITAEVSIETLEINGLFTNENDLITALKKLYETDEKKLVHINSRTTKEILYGMLEEDFIKLAKVLPPRTKTE